MAFDRCLVVADLLIGGTYFPMIFKILGIDITIRNRQASDMAATHAVALHFMFYNFGRIHQSLRVTPAMEAGLTDHVWSLEEIEALSDSERNCSGNSERKIAEIDV